MSASIAICLDLLGGFELRLDDQVVPVSIASQRLIVFLALHDRLLPRSYVAGTLWPEVQTARANANLRAGLWRLPAAGRLLIDQSTQHLCLAARATVDVPNATALAQRLLDRSKPCTADDLAGASRRALSAELLPTWYDDWVLVERERFHQLRLHALEALCEQLITAGRYGEAIDAGLAAVAAEPLRESAHRRLIMAHLAEDNHAEAHRQYQLCRHLLHTELGVEPSQALRELLSERRQVLTGTVTRR